MLRGFWPHLDLGCVSRLGPEHLAIHSFTQKTKNRLLEFHVAVTMTPTWQAVSLSL